MDRRISPTALVLAFLCLIPTTVLAPSSVSGEQMADFVEFNIIVLKPGVDETAFVSELRVWMANCYRLEECKRIDLLTPMNLSFAELGIERMEPLPRHYGWIKVWDDQETFHTMQQNTSEEYKQHVDFLHNRIYGQSVIVTLHYTNSYTVAD